MLEISNISKKLGNKNVLFNLNLIVGGGQCFGLLGQNGAGKSTLLNCIVDLIKPDSGYIKINGFSYDSNNIEIKKNIGIVSEFNPLIEEFNGWQYLNFVGLLHKIPNKELQERIESIVLFFFKETSVLQNRIATYSTGMKKKLSICAAVLHRPSLLLLDEPFTGLDIVAINQLTGFLNYYLNSSRSIVISSHDLNYVQKVATHIAVLHEANIVFDDTLTAFTTNGTEQINEALYKILAPHDIAINLAGIQWVK